MTQDQANADLAQAAQLVAGALAYYEQQMAENQEVLMLHGLLSRVAARAEQIAGVIPGTFNVQPLDGSPKGPPGN